MWFRSKRRARIVKTKLLLSLCVLLFALFGKAAEPEPVEPPATITYLNAEPTSGGYTIYRFRAVNCSKVSLFYFGYSPASPTYYCEMKRWFRWRDRTPGWCGTGDYLRQLRPGASIVFEAVRPGMFWPWRVGIGFYKSASASSKSTTIWSPSMRN